MFEDIKGWLKSRLDEERYSHSIGAEEAARDLAKRFGVDPDKAALAALIHDNAKHIPNDKLLEIIDQNNLPVSEMEKKSLKVLHAPVGAYLAEKELGIEDPEILNAIKYHTTGKVDMSDFEKVVYLADKIEPYTREPEYRQKIVDKLNETGNLDETVLLTYDMTIRSLLDRKMIINPETIDVWNSLLSSLNK